MSGSQVVIFSQAIRRITLKSRVISKLRDDSLELSYRYEIWQASRQQCCRDACQISKRYDNCNTQSRGFETSWDLTVRDPGGGVFTSSAHGRLLSRLAPIAYSPMCGHVYGRDTVPCIPLSIMSNCQFPSMLPLPFIEGDLTAHAMFWQWPKDWPAHSDRSCDIHNAI